MFVVDVVGCVFVLVVWFFLLIGVWLFVVVCVLLM